MLQAPIHCTLPQKADLPAKSGQAIHFFLSPAHMVLHHAQRHRHRAKDLHSASVDALADGHGQHEFANNCIHNLYNYLPKHRQKLKSRCWITRSNRSRGGGD